MVKRIKEIKMNIFVFNTSIEVIRVYLEYKNFEKEKIDYLLKSIKFIDMDIDKIGFFSKFKLNYNFSDNIFPYISGFDDNIELNFILHFNNDIITVEGVTSDGEEYIFNKNLNNFKLND